MIDMRIIKRFRFFFNGIAKIVIHAIGPLFVRPRIGRSDPNAFERGEKHRILFVCLAYRGDLLLTFPVIAALKRHFPNSHLTCWVREYNEALARMNPDINDIVVYDKFPVNPLKSMVEFFVGAKHRGLIQNMQKYDIYVDDSGYAFTSLAGYRAKIPLRIGRNFQGLGFLNHFEYPLDTDTQLIVRRLKLLRTFDLELSLNDICKPYFTIDINIRAKVQREYGIAELNYFTVQPFAGWAAKNWGIDRYCRVARHFVSQSNLMPVFLGSQEERALIDEALSRHKLDAINLAGKGGMEKAMAIIAGARLHFGADSVGSQAAISLGVTSLTIFGPVNPILSSYLGGGNFGIIKRTRCTPRSDKLYCCFDAGRSCKRLSCMKELREEDVLNTLTDIWSGKELSTVVET
jgi:ADP-heptose:LPS heptosyltransferase